MYATTKQDQHIAFLFPSDFPSSKCIKISSRKELESLFNALKAHIQKYKFYLIPQLRNH